MFSWRRTVLRRRVLVNLKTEKAFSGLLWSKSGPLVVMKQAQLHEAAREPVVLDGEIIIERQNIDFIQVLPEGTRGDRSE